MAFRRTARAIVERSNIQFDDWMEELRNQNEGAVPKDFVARTAKTILRKCDPKQYLLSHATIVASVDCYSPKMPKIGRSMNRGVQIDARWPDFRIVPECHDIINNNGDAWERSLLLSSYRTFIGAHNYLEHIQLPELSKGFIVDAIARDLGKSCYIDILVATDRKHNQLVSDILTGAITGLSMGCISLFTTCTRCGNVASDDSQLCPCIQYDGKGSKFSDENGVEHPLSEIIGHVSVPNSNQFIEASWVRNPAFRGAVRRNILNPDSSHYAAQMTKSNSIHVLRSSLPEMSGIKKAASLRFGQAGQGDQISQDQSDEELFGDQGAQDQGGQGAQDQGGQGQGGQGQGGQGQNESPELKSDKIDELLEKAQEQLLTIMVEKLGEKLAPKPSDVGVVASPIDLESSNDSMVRSSEEFGRKVKSKFPTNAKLIRWAMTAWKIVHEQGVSGVRKAGMTPKDLIVLSWIEDSCRGRSYSSNLYKVAMDVGAMKKFPSEISYIAACKKRLGRNLSVVERDFLIWKGRISSVSSNC